MAIDPSVLINLAAEYTGKPAFDKAGKATSKLEKGVKSLGKAFGVAFAASTVVNYSRQAVKAFAADEAAALRLTRAVENLGIGFANPAITKYIADLERSSAIADDILRPAFQALLTTTGSLTKSQELLNNAIQISRASGIDLATVSQDLANGYVGITKGLKKYNTGLTTAELSSKSFAEVLGIMLTKSAGAANDYLGTTQYKMDALTLATGNASEILGGGLVNAFARIAGGTEASDAAKAIEDIATAVAFLTETIGTVIGVIPNLLKTLGNIPKNLVEGFAGAQVGKNLTPKPSVKKTPVQLTQQQQAKALAKLEADAIKRQKELLALQKKQTAATKAAALKDLKLKEAAAAFDITKIGIAAALKNTYDKDERLRLLAMQAIENDNGEAALKYIEQLDILTKAQQTDKLNGLKGITDSELSSINKILLADLEAIRASKMSEEDKAKARQEAYNKYNAAISASGGLNDAQYYSEKTQIELLKIAKIAALDDVSAAQTTLLSIAKSDELDVIKIIQTAQKTADDAKYKALQDYIALIKSVPQVSAITQTPSGIVSVTPTPGTGGTTNIPEIPTTNVPIPTNGNFGYSLPEYLKSGANIQGGGYTPPVQNITVNIEGMIDTGNFDEVVNQAFVNAQRKGLSQSVAGSLPGAG